MVNSIPPATSIGWIKTQQGVTTTINVSLSKYSGGTISDPSLRIYDADLSDEGSYVCSATNIVGTGTSQEMSLSVVVCKYAVFLLIINRNSCLIRRLLRWLFFNNYMYVSKLLFLNSHPFCFCPSIYWISNCHIIHWIFFSKVHEGTHVCPSVKYLVYTYQSFIFHAVFLFYFF